VPVKEITVRAVKLELFYQYLKKGLLCRRIDHRGAVRNPRLQLIVEIGVLLELLQQEG
jgi:hypothetical protein